MSEVLENVPRVDFNGHVGEGSRGDEEMFERNAEGQMPVDFTKRMEIAVVRRRGREITSS